MGIQAWLPREVHQQAARLILRLPFELLVLRNELLGFGDFENWLPLPVFIKDGLSMSVKIFTV